MSEGKIILKAEDVRTYFPVKGALGQTVKEVKAVDGVSLALRQGETYGLVGESGCGKSTLGRTLIRLLEPTSGKITLFDQDITHLSKKEMLPFRRDVQIVFQDPYTSLNPRQRVGDMLMEVLAIHHIGDKNERMARALDIMAQVGLRPEHFYRYPHEFSGGMRQRALIAIGLACRPDLLIADEPTSALDVTVQKKILDHLHMLTDSLGTAVLFITHDLGLAAERAQHIVVMYKGQVVESGPSLEVLQHPQHPYTKRLVAAAPSLASQRIISAKERGENADALLDHHIAGESTLEKSEHIITVDHLTKEFKLPRKKEMFKAVDDVSFSVKRGTTLAIVGESGSGKSTVANMVLHLLKPTSGKVFYEGRDTSTFKAKDLLGFRRHVQPVFQNPYGSLDPMYSIFRSIEEPLRIHKIGDSKWRANRVKELLDMVEMPASVMGRYPNELSGGQRQRIAIARAMALDPDVIVCDEAVSALDVLVQDQVLRLLNDLQAEKGLSYLFITHDLAVVRQIADEVVVMQHGKLVEHATTDEVFDHPQKQYTRDLLDAIPGGKLQLGLD